MSAFEFYPAIDLLAGRVVRLQTGDYSAETVYGDDPVAVAREFRDAGAAWIHIVDLDAARTGEATNRAAIAAVADAVAGDCRVQSGGGVRSLDDARALADAGVSRVVMGSAALAQPELVAEVAELVAVAVGLDHRGGELAVDGWTRSGGEHIDAVLHRYPDAAAFVVTDIARDGMLSGPDLDGLSALAAASPIPVIASGGVSGVDDVVALEHLGTLAGVIVGRALYEHRLGVAEALAAIAGRRDRGSGGER
jgi:phosphoribosylformimino-5-aminoimidazole carboxamide ribotide isomerase